VGSGRYAIMRNSMELAVHGGVSVRKDFIARVSVALLCGR
jgi:hypothetical protein